MKKLAKISLVLILALMLALVFVACGNTDSTTDDEDEGGSDIEPTKYTVVFVTDGDIELSKSTYTYLSSEKIVCPETIPVKKGYTFKFWSSDGGSTAFDFDNYNFEEEDLTGTLTITAYYTNNTYTHSKSTIAYLNRNVDVDENVTYSLSTQYYDSNKYPDGNLTLTSTYAQKSTLTVPSTTTDDSFCFYYYMEDGKPVQFTQMWDKESSTVSMLNNYDKTEKLTLYAMWESNLKEIAPVTVNYIDPQATNTLETLSVAHLARDNVFETETSTFTKTSYTLKGFNYVANTDDDVEKFVFATKTTVSEEETITEGTSLLDILEDTEKFTDYFTPTSIDLTAIWSHDISITSVSEYKSKLYDVMQGTDEDAKSDILNATIMFNCANDYDFSTIDALYPLFDSEHVFKGTIKSSTKGTKVFLDNVSLKGKDNASLLGYIDGNVSDIKLEVASITIEKDSEAYSDNVLVGGLCTSNLGYIDSCYVSIASLEIGSETATDAADKFNVVTFGGIATLNNGIEPDEDEEEDTDAVYTTDQRGRIYNSTVMVSQLKIYAEGVTIGGIVGDAGTLSRIVSGISTLESVSVVTNSDSDSTNGNPFFKFGGVAGTNGGEIASTTATISLANSATAGDAYIGGAVGANAGSISKVKADGTINDNIGGTIQNVGGLVGLNEGAINNSYSKVKIEITGTLGSSFMNVGGIVGSNISDKEASSTIVGYIATSYSTNSIKVDCGTLENVILNVGGIAGRNAYENVDCFTTNTITVINNGTNNIGYIYGSLERDAEPQNMYRAIATENPITVNEETQAESEIIPSWELSTELKNFVDATWIFGDEATSTDGHIAFSSSIWEINSGELVLK